VGAASHAPSHCPSLAVIPYGHRRSLARVFSSRYLPCPVVGVASSRVESSRMAAPVAGRSIDPSRRAAQSTEAIALRSSASIKVHLPPRSRSAPSISARWEAQSWLALATSVTCRLGMLNPLAGASSLTCGGDIINVSEWTRRKLHARGRAEIWLVDDVLRLSQGQNDSTAAFACKSVRMWHCLYKLFYIVCDVTRDVLSGSGVQ
jgi:hypothetical protein